MSKSIVVVGELELEVLRGQQGDEEKGLWWRRSGSGDWEEADARAMRDYLMGKHCRRLPLGEYLDGQQQGWRAHQCISLAAVECDMCCHRLEQQRQEQEQEKEQEMEMEQGQQQLSTG